MKKFWIVFLALLLILAVPMTAAAQEAGCTITADTVAAAPGTTVTVPVRITNNPGFTNFAIVIKYDAAKLKLEKIDTLSTTEETYLCPENASVNLTYTAKEGDIPCGYVNSAASEAVTGDGILFTMTFTVLSQATSDAVVDLELQYLRSADAVTSIFTALTASTTDGTIHIAQMGDVDGDGSITDADAAFVYRSVNENLTLTEVQRSSADVNNDGMVDTTDAALIYRVVHKTLTGFPQTILEEVTE